MNAIVFTTINGPTPSIETWASIKGYELIGVGDKKTPDKWDHDKVDFLHHGDHKAVAQNLSGVLPWNHYCRKNIGYVHAIDHGAEVIVDTDDDNQPYENWVLPPFHGFFYTVDGSPEFVNVYRIFTAYRREVWPRGYPLSRLLTSREPYQLVERECKVGIWQGLADGDPDVDAIYRLTQERSLKPFSFLNAHPTVLDSGSVCPFNSQNTVFCKELFPLLYLPAVSFRFTDILRSFVAQPIMWLMGYKLGFTEATVMQVRNPHDYMDDFESELPMYKYSEQIYKDVKRVVKKSNSIGANLLAAYQELAKVGIVDNEEQQRVRAWLKAVKC